MSGTKRWIALARSSEVTEGQAKIFEAADLRIAVCRVEGKVYAVQDLCTHDDGPLGEGCLDGHAIECPRHGARFDVRDGRVLRMPAAFPVRVFPASEKDGRIHVEIDE